MPGLVFGEHAKDLLIRWSRDVNMNQTMLLIVSAVFSIIFFGMVMTTVFEKKAETEERSFLLVQHTWNGTRLIVSWEASEPSDGVLHYVMHGVEATAADHSFETMHKISIENATRGVGYYIEACDISGVCFKSDARNAS
jgi:hypothetical protein